jgi:hypothetical protein
VGEEGKEALVRGKEGGWLGRREGVGTDERRWRKAPRGFVSDGALME